MSMETNLPATRPEPEEEADERPVLAPRPPVTVAFLPLALVVFILLALTIAAWTFLSATT
jgi:hypothetical protein